MDTTKPTVAFLGLGHMGAGMARRLGAAGFRLRLWNRTTERATRLASELDDAVACTTPREAARDAAFVVTSLADDAAMRAVCCDERDGLLAGLAADAVHLGTSTLSVALVTELVARHADAAAHYLAAPVFGRPDAAARGELLVITGGGGAPDLVTRCQPIFAAIGRGTLPVDTAPQAALLKLVGNYCIAGTIELLAEALTLAEKGGIAPERTMELLSGDLFGSPLVRGYGGRIARGEFEPAGFAMPLGLKDVTLALESGAALRVPLPLGSLVRDHLLAALAQGREHLDWAGLATVLRDQAGLGR